MPQQSKDTSSRGTTSKETDRTNNSADDQSDLIIITASDMPPREEPVKVRRPNIRDERPVRISHKDANDEWVEAKASSSDPGVCVQDVQSLKDVDRLVKKGESGAVVYSLDDEEKDTGKRTDDN